MSRTDNNRGMSVAGITIALCFAILLAGIIPSVRSECVNDMPAVCSPTTKTAATGWTVLVYINGDCNIETNAIASFLDISSVGSRTNMNVVALFDRINSGESWDDTSYGNWGDTKLFHVTSGMEPVPGSALSDMGELDMGNASTLTNFVDWGIGNYTASHYALFIWDHGAGWPGCCYDNTSNEDRLTPVELRQSLSSVYNKTGVKLDVVGFDCCLMATIEVPYELQGYADRFVASEQVISVDSWPFNAILSALASNTAMNASELGNTIVNCYMAKYGTGGSDTLSSLEMSRFSVLSSAMANFSTALFFNDTLHSSEISAARLVTQQYMAGKSNSDDVDIYDFASQLCKKTNSPALKSLAKSVMAAVNATVEYEGHGIAGAANSHGIAIYFPREAAYFSKLYDKGTFELGFTRDTSWDEFLRRHYGFPYIQFVHAPVKSALQDQPVGITVRIISDKPVTVAKVNYRLANESNWHSLNMTKTSGTATDGTYAAQIPGQKAGVMVYYISASDTSALNATTPGYDVKIMAQVPDGMPVFLLLPMITIAVYVLIGRKKRCL